jgi:hypothetical protein
MTLSTNVTFIYQEMIDFGDLRAIRSISPMRGLNRRFLEQNRTNAACKLSISLTGIETKRREA